MVKVARTKTIKVTKRWLEISKRPKAKNLPNRRVSISVAEKNQVKENDTVTLKIFNSKNELLESRCYTAEQFHKGLIRMEKRHRYSSYPVVYFLLRY